MRVLFVVKEFLPKPTPPGICIMNVRNALLEKGVKSDVLMVGDKEGIYKTDDVGTVYSIQSKITFEKGKEGLFSYIKTRIPMLLTWPVPSMKRVRDYQRMIKELDSNYHYDAIIGAMFPPDVCVACSVFEHFFYYEFDSLVNNPMYKERFKKYLSYRLYRLEKKLFDRAELIIHLNQNKPFYSKAKYDRYSHKTVYTDIPELVEIPFSHADAINNNTNSSCKVVMVYSGHLSKEYRSPTILISLIKKIATVINVECLFFSRGDCEDELRKAEEDTKGIIRRMGYVSQEELSYYTDKADFLLDIGNRLSGEDYSLPSKVICYMAIGKPIIHLNGVNDSAIDYLEKYGLSINIGDDTLSDDTIQSVLSFIINNRGKHIPFQEVETAFPQNTPAYTADIIINQINNRPH